MNRSLLLLSVLLPASRGTAWGAPKELGWILDSSKWVERTELEAPFVMQAYKRGESEERWTERMQISRHPMSAEGAGEGVFRARQQDYSRQLECRDFRATDIPAKLEDGSRLAIWVCPRIGKSKLGRIAFVRVFGGAGQTYMVLFEMQRRHFGKSKFPMPEDMFDGWMRIAASVNTCEHLTDAGCWPSPETYHTATVRKPAAELQLEIDRVMRLGRAMFEQDQIAWQGTDAYLNSEAFDAARSGGFLAIADGSVPAVYFVDERAGVVTSAVPVVRARDGWFDVQASQPELPAEVRPRYEALRKVRENLSEMRCSEKLNTIVLPADHPGRWSVYVMSATEQEGLAWIGGHARYEVDALGQIVATQASAKSCLAVDFALAEKQAGSAELQGGFITHLLSNTPTEFHVFASLNHPYPLHVISDLGVWRVYRGQVELLDL